MKRLVLGGLTVAAAALAVAVLMKRESAPEVRLNGIVSANETPVASEFAGRILELRVNEGERISEGQVVAVLASEELDAKIQSKRDAVDQIRARLEESRERIRLETARVESRIDEATAKLRALEKDQVVIRAELDGAQSELARAREIFGQGLIPRQEVDGKAAALEVIKAKLKTAEDQVVKARASLESERAGERKVRVMQQELQQTAAEAAQARYELEQITVRLGRTELKSPRTGIVARKKAREGELVPAGAPVMTIADPTDVWIRAEVEEGLARRLVVGQPLRVILSPTNEADGKVNFISAEAVGEVKGERTFEIRVALLSPEDGIHPGMTASIVVPGRGEIATPAPTVPRTADGPREAEIEHPPANSGGAPAAQEASNANSKPPASGSTHETGEAGEAPDAPDAHDERQARTEAQSRQSRAVPPEPVSPPSPAIREPAPPTRPAAEVQQPSETASRRTTDPTSARPTPSVEELLERIDLENPTEEDLRELEALMLQEAGQVDEVPPREALPPPAELPPPAARPAPPAVAAAPVVNPAQFRLEGISVVGGRPIAVINGARVFEGDMVEGARVILIMGSMVQLAFEGRTMTLRF